MSKHLILLGLVGLVLGCSPQPTQAPEVKHVGMLREIMHEGQIAARLRVDTLEAKHLFALGASDSLSGEVMTLDGRTYESFVEDSVAKVVQSDRAEATLFVYTYVSAWDTLAFSVPNGNLDSALADAAQRHGVQEPFVFQLLGRPDLVDYHVVRYDPEFPIEKHREMAWHGQIEKKPVTFLGFYAEHAQGVYTHHSTYTHVHVLSDDTRSMGHVEAVLGWGDVQLLLPAR